MKRSRIMVAAAAFTTAALALSGCSATTGGDGDGKTTLNFRTWDAAAAEAYTASFEAFTKENPDITVKVTVIPWGDYFTKLRTDIAGGSADDIFWINNSSYSDYATNGNLLDIDATLGASAKDAWAPAVVEQFTQDGKLWGVPQTSDGGIGIYYNKKMIADAGLTEDDISNLVWSPDGTGDTLLPTAQKLTIDSAGLTADQPGFDVNNVAQWGYSAAQDLQGIYLPFIGSAGGTYQDGDMFTFTNPKTESAFSYIVDLINKHHVSPGAADSNADGSFTMNQFTQGKMALFQSGLYNMANISDNVTFEWGTAMLPAGPAGAVSVTNGVVVAGNAKSEHPEATKKVLEWLGSTAGNEFIGASGANLPGVTAAQQVYFDFWKGKNVDVAPFFDVIKDKPTIPAPTGANFNASFAAFKPIFDEIFLGRTPVDEGLKAAEEAANTAMKG